MTTKNNVTLLNLQQQVEKNRQDIAAHYEIDRVLANFGIRVLGQLDTYEDIATATPPVGGYKRGDAYAIGTEAPYTFYIYTENAADEYFWMDVGQLSIVGPEGPKGDKGDKGDTGKAAIWYVSNSRPSTGTEGDMWLDGTGGVSRFTNDNWIYFTNIKGPQGPQGIQGRQGEQGEQGERGIQGPQGNPGRGFRVIGVGDTIDLLPTPTEAILDNAWVISGNLYMIVGEPGNLSWHDYGPFPTVSTTGTTVYKNGVAQSTWDATGVNVKNDRSYDLVPVLKANNGGLVGYSALNAGNPQAYTFPVRNANGEIVGNTSDASGDTVLINKAYFKANIPSPVNNLSYPFAIIADQENKGYGRKAITSNAGAYSLCQYTDIGAVSAKCSASRRGGVGANASVSVASQAITKNWYNATPTKLADFNNTQSITIDNYNGEEWAIQGNREFWYWDNNLESYYYIGKMAFGLAAADLHNVYCANNYDGNNRINIEYIAQSGQLSISNTRAGYGSIYIL